ncbi:MAG: biopolymer transporter ExbD, partial [Bacteroidota bacterium]
PQSDSQTVAPTNIVVQLEQDGKTTVNNVEVSGSDIERAIVDALRQVDDQEEATVTIVAEIGVPFGRVTPIMTVAARNRARAIIATQARG